MSALHEPGFTHVKSWALRWWKEPEWPVSRIQIVFFFHRGGKVNFAIGKTMAEDWMKDLHETERDGDSFHYFIHRPDMPGFSLSRSTAAGFRKALHQILEEGPARSPFKGYASEDMQTGVGNLVQVESKQGARWV